MSNVVVHKKPMLVVLEQKRKLAQYGQHEVLTTVKKLVDNLLNDLGVGTGNSDHHVRTIKFIMDNYLHYSPEEIEKAFSLYIKNELVVPVFQQLNSVVVGKVMSAYEEYKTKKLAEYRRKQLEQKNKPKPMTAQEIEFIMIEGCDRLFKNYVSTKEIDGMYTHIYDYLFDKNLLPTDKLYKQAIFAKAKIMAVRERKEEGHSQHQKKAIIEKAVEQILEGGDNSKSILISKKLVLIDYFDKLIREDKNLTDEI